MKTYKIIRFFRAPRKGKVIKRHLSLEETQAHCRRSDTHKRNADNNIVWFDGYEKE